MPAKNCNEALALLRPRLEDVELRGDFADIDLTVSQDGAAALFAFAVLVLPQRIAGLGIQAEKPAGFLRDIEFALVDDRRGIAGDDAFLAPDELGLPLDDFAGVEADEAALDVGAGAFFAMADVDEVA